MSLDVTVPRIVIVRDLVYFVSFAHAHAWI